MQGAEHQDHLLWMNVRSIEERDLPLESVKNRLKLLVLDLDHCSVQLADLSQQKNLVQS